VATRGRGPGSGESVRSTGTVPASTPAAAWAAVSGSSPRLLAAEAVQLVGAGGRVEQPQARTGQQARRCHCQQPRLRGPGGHHGYRDGGPGHEGQLHPDRVHGVARTTTVLRHQDAEGLAHHGEDRNTEDATEDGSHQQPGVGQEAGHAEDDRLADDGGHQSTSQPEPVHLPATPRSPGGRTDGEGCRHPSGGRVAPVQRGHHVQRQDQGRTRVREPRQHPEQQQGADVPLRQERTIGGQGHDAQALTGHRHNRNRWSIGRWSGPGRPMSRSGTDNLRGVRRGRPAARPSPPGRPRPGWRRAPL